MHLQIFVGGIQAIQTFITGGTGSDALPWSYINQQVCLLRVESWQRLCVLPQGCAALFL